MYVYVAYLMYVEYRTKNGALNHGRKVHALQCASIVTRWPRLLPRQKTWLWISQISRAEGGQKKFFLILEMFGFGV